MGARDTGCSLLTESAAEARTLSEMSNFSATPAKPGGLSLTLGSISVGRQSPGGGSARGFPPPTRVADSSPQWLLGFGAQAQLAGAPVISSERTSRLRSFGNTASLRRLERAATYCGSHGSMISHAEKQKRQIAPVSEEDDSPYESLAWTDLLARQRLQLTHSVRATHGSTGTEGKSETAARIAHSRLCTFYLYVIRRLDARSHTW